MSTLVAPTSGGTSLRVVMDLSTEYLGLKLPHPFMPGASPLTKDLDMVSRLEDAGASAIVMHSLFEEEVLATVSEPAGYLEQLLRIKRRVAVPVIASLNGTNAEGWLRYAHVIQEAGADALELNFYHVAIDPFEDALHVERRLIDIVAVLKESIAIPLVVKLSPFYSALPHLAAQLDRLGADGLVLFNRFCQPDFDPASGETVMRMSLSDPSELAVRLRWTAILANQVRASLALSGGVHEAIGAVKSIAAGAHVVQLVSALIRSGPACLTTIRREFERWGDLNGYESVSSLRGRMSLAAYQGRDGERGPYKRIVQSLPASSH
jgi:dihydroorotate dehydrogenase (fumarate)